MAGLTGKIYDLSGKVGGARTPHPHVVVIELAQECLLIPAFTSGRHELEDYKRTVFAALGLREDQACVEIDNRRPRPILRRPPRQPGDVGRRTRRPVDPQGVGGPAGGR
jgi:hypothetical protein